MELENKALEFAREKHKGQYRKGKDKIEYINHPINVANKLKLYFEYDENMVAAALLHDTLEDTNTTYEELVKEFNIDVANLVDELTSNKEEQNTLGKVNYLSIKMAQISERALNIKLCDRLDNILDCLPLNDHFRDKYIIETIQIMSNLILDRELTDDQLKIVDIIYNICSEFYQKNKRLVLSYNN